MRRNGLPLALGLVAFLVYLPSLGSDLVYDGEREIREEGFITHLSNLPAVLTFKVLGMDLALGSRPGQMLFMMLIAAIAGQHPFAYHLASLLLHAANVALLFVLLRRLAGAERVGAGSVASWRKESAMALAVLVFALHPIAVESVAEVSYSSSLLVLLFTLLALRLAIGFRPENSRRAWIIGGAGVLCTFASITCKESGIATPLCLIIYWLLYRRAEAKRGWLGFLGSALGVSLLFLAARFHFAPPAPYPLPYLNGSITGVLLTQPRVWVFMLGKLAWPTGLSADYTLPDLPLPPTALAFLLLSGVVAVQAWLGGKSRIAALGMAFFWFGLMTVSNLIPLNRFLADRFYYLPLAGIAMELLAALLLLAARPRAFAVAGALVAIALVPCLILTVQRQAVFADSFALWTDTLRNDPHSAEAHDGVGLVLASRGQPEQAIEEYRAAIAISPTFPQAHYNLGLSLFHSGHAAEAMREYRTAITLNPRYTAAYSNLGMAFLEKGDLPRAMALCRKALSLDPHFVQALNNLGIALNRTGQVKEAIGDFEEALSFDPGESQIHYNLAGALAKAGRTDEAIAQYRVALQLRPDYAEARNNLGILLFQLGRLDEAQAQFQAALAAAPDNVEARGNFALTLAKLGRLDEAIAQYRAILATEPGLPAIHSNLGALLLQAGRVEEAIAECQAALKLEPNFAEAQKNLARAEAQRGAKPPGP
jgi:tetratricopeptide (TPR) repeat protein